MCASRRLGPVSIAVLAAAAASLSLGACGDSSGDGSTSGATTGTGGGTPTPSGACLSDVPPAPDTDCTKVDVLCVDDAPGPTQEYPTIQAAVDVAGPGSTVVVADGSYAGFRVATSGTASSPIVIFANGSAVSIVSPAPTGDGIRLQNVSHVRVEGFHIQAVPQRCLAARDALPDVPMVGLRIRGNTCVGAGVEGFYLSEVSASKIELNTITGTGTSGDIRSHGIYLANAGSDDTVLCGNVISGAAPAESNGIHFNGDLSVGGDGIISGLTVEANVVFGNAQNGFNMDGVQDSRIVNNVVYENGRNALRAYAIDAAAGPRNLVVVGNTFLGDGGWAFKCSEDLGGHIAFDNVLLSADPDGGAISVEDTSLRTSHNVVTDAISIDGESSILTLAQLIGATSVDEGSIVAAPGALFVGPAAGDFHLVGGAPAVDAGVADFLGQSAPSFDLEGTARPNGAAFDIGAYER